MKLKKKDLDSLKYNYLEQSVANLQLSNCEKDLKILELELDKKRLEMDIKRNIGKTLLEKVKSCKEDRKEIIEKIKKDYKLEEFKGYDPETGEIV
jgi:hypothetical protein